MYCISFATPLRPCLVIYMHALQIRLPEFNQLERRSVWDLSRNRDSLVLAVDRAFLAFLAGSSPSNSWRDFFPDVGLWSMIMSATAVKKAASEQVFVQLSLHHLLYEVPDPSREKDSQSNQQAKRARVMDWT